MPGAPLITTDEAFDLLIEACPSYWDAPALDRYVAAFEDEGTPDLYVRSSAFAHHLVDLLAAGRTDEVAAALPVVDHLLAEGDPETVELVVMGLIEPMQNITSHEDVLVGPDRVEPLLGPLARARWDEQDELWREAARFLHDGPRVGEAEYANITDPNLRRYYQAHKRRMVDGTLISASDIVNYQEMLRNISPVLPAGRQFSWTAVIVGLLLAGALLIALSRR